MHKQTKIAAAVLLTFGGLSAWAQQAEPQQIERVTVTGSAIKRIDAETAVPVTVIKMAELKSQGVTSVEQILGLLSSVQATQNMASSIGSGTGGASYANMRGIGADKTLVLLNGQRIANSATGAEAPDMNMIPFAAIERVEVLRDGASSLYGTDAIGGVINFITKTSFTGGTLSVGYDAPKKAGGDTNSANLGYGLGDLSKDGWNIFGTLSLKKRDFINGDQRDFNKRMVGGLSNSTFPANYQVTGGGAYYNPIAPGCNAPNLIPNAGATGCRIVTPPFVSINPRSETISGLLKGTVDATSSLRLGAEAFYSKNTVESKIAPVPYGGYWINPGTKYFPTAALSNPKYSPNFDYYGADGEPFNNPTAQFPKPVNLQKGGVLVWWRDLVSGPRQEKNNAKQYRGMFTAEGNAAGWDYKAALAYNHTQNDRYLTGGYADGDVIGEGLIRGIINPFGDQTPESVALIQSAALKGLLSTSIGKVSSLTASASRELGDWFGATRPVQIAVGGEFRHEDFRDFNHHDFAVAASSSTGVDPDAHSEGKRNVSAAYTELNMPLTKELELTASVRFDKYSDFGNTTNPKLSFRYQPSKELLLRGSASTGFRAPTLYELNASTGFTNTNNYDNPLNCPGGVPKDPATAGANCAAQFQAYFGGNKDLKPEKSKSFTLGMVFEPVKGLSTSVDFWSIRVKDLIGSISEATLFGDYQTFQQYFHFVQPGNILPQNTRACQNGPTSPTCGYVDERTQNLGGVNTQGIDLGMQYQLTTSFGRLGFEYQSTYVSKYEYQDYKNGPWHQNVGIYSGSGPVFKWQHNLAGSWSQGSWGAGLALHYKSGYKDMTPTNTVKAYATADAYVSFSPMKAFTLVAGVRNLTDRDPPFSNQTALFQGGGWDSRFYDPIGRTVYVRGTLDF
ncbi:TonB-dependent receptor [Roseateles sp.]|uniref:TonB-dependent receptor n=1 Tax=Roseateles sp. TaxID=1971397 RepID=UPI0025CD8980|nr:TonB-dependent receptor [Roseateles sp.]MBV8035229.1 TonB-dependent receptor [Roseateles sp.]